MPRDDCLFSSYQETQTSSSNERKKFPPYVVPNMVKLLNHTMKQVVPDAGHSANEPGIAAELVAANEKLKNIIKNKGD